jgi:protein FAM32A
MPNDEYSTAIGGGLKLKGGKPRGVVKKKKKKDKEKSNVKGAIEEAVSSTETAVVKKSTDGEGGQSSFKVHEEEADNGNDYGYGDGKTEAERKHEEMRKKRVCPKSHQT